MGQAVPGLRLGSGFLPGSFWVKAHGFREHAHCIVNPGCKRDKLTEWSIFGSQFQTETQSPLSVFHGEAGYLTQLILSGAEN